MGPVNQPARSELARLALAGARRVAARLREQEIDLARKMPGDARGGEALRNAASAAERVAKLLERPATGRTEPPSHP